MNKIRDFLSGFNPFWLPKFFRQNKVNSNVKPSGKGEIASNVIFLVMYSTIFYLAIHGTPREDLYGSKRYNFISQMKFCIQFYCMSLFLYLIGVKITVQRREITYVMRELVKFRQKFDKIGIKLSINNKWVLSLYVVAFASLVVILAVDITCHGKNYSPYLWICLYLPGISATIYVINFISMCMSCIVPFGSLNKQLEDLLLPQAAQLERIALLRKNLKPRKLLSKAPGEHYTMFEHIFMLHDDICEVARRINKLTGYELATYIGFSYVCFLSVLYDFCIDMIRISKNTPVPETTVYAPNYWGFVYICGTAAVIETCSELTSHANHTKILLHKLMNIYPALQEYGENYSLQLMQQELTITAGHFFALNRSIAFKFISGFVTYIVLLMQLDTDTSFKR